MMRKLLLASAVAAIATPAVARDGSPYVGLEGGVLFPQHMTGTYTSTFTQTAQTPAAGTTAVLPGVGVVGTLPAAFTTVPTVVTGSADTRFKTGYDIDAIAGYDFGMFRLEGELGYKRSNIKSFAQDSAFAAGVTTALNPAGATVTTPFVFPTGSLTTFNIGNNVNIWSGMINALIDVGDENGVSFYAGGGIGRARVKLFQISDSAWAYQGIAGIRFALGSNVDIGLKYRYFQTGRLDFLPTATAFTSTATVAVPNVPAVTGGPASGSTNVAFTRTANVFGTFRDHFSSHSLLLSLAYNFGGAAAEPLPPPPPPPPPPPAPATQTCPDGSVIDATATCPAPPPPPPPPPPAQRGERG
jgi:opacity protein-like surface antigen